MHPRSSPTGILTLALLVLIIGMVPSVTLATPLNEARARYDAGDLVSATVLLKQLTLDEPDNAAARLLLGQTYLDLLVPGLAEVEFKRVRAAGASSEEWLPSQARLWLVQGQFQSLLNEVDAGKITDPARRAELFILRADAFLGLGQIEGASIELGKAEATGVAREASLLGQARLALALGHVAEARNLIGKAVTEAPKSPRAWRQLGDLEYAQGRYAEAETAYTAGLDQAPDKWALYLQRALARLALNNLVGAEQDIAEATRQNRQFPALGYARGLLDIKQGKAQAALDELNLVLKAAPGNRDAQYAAAVAAGQLGQDQQAEAYLDLVLRGSPQFAPALQLKVALRMRRGDFAKAEELIGPLAEAKTASAEIVALHGRALAGLGRVPEAQTAFRRALELEPSPVRQLELAQLLAAGGDFKAALPLVRSVIATSPKNDQARLLEVQLLLTSKDIKTAAARAEEFAAGAPQDPVARHNLGLAREASGDLDGARRAYQEALSLDKHFSRAAVALAKLDIQAGNTAAAAERLRQVEQLDPGNTFALLASVQLDLLASGNRAAALARLEQALRDHPQDATIRETLATIKLQAGDPQGALGLIGDENFSGKAPPSLLPLRAAAELAVGQVYNADKTIRAYLEYAPQDPVGHYLAAQVAARSENYSDMIQQFAEGVRLAPNDPFARVVLADITAASNGAETHQQLIEAMRATPKAQPLVTLAELQWAVKLADYATAERLYDQLVKVAPTDRALVVGLLRSQLAVSHSAAAANTAQAWLSKHPADVEMWVYAGQVHEQRNQPTDAIRAYEEALKTDANNVLALNNVAMLLVGQDAARALAYARRAARFAPDDAEIADTLGFVLLSSGDAAGAVPILERAYRGQAGNRSIAFHYASALATVGQGSQARRILLELAPGAFPEQAQAQALLKKLVQATTE